MIRLFKNLRYFLILSFCLACIFCNLCFLIRRKNACFIWVWSGCIYVLWAYSELFLLFIVQVHCSIVVYIIFFFIIKYKLSCYISAFSAFSFSSILLICSFHFFRCQILFYIILLCANRNTTIWYNLCFIKISNLREQKKQKTNGENI